MNLIGRYQRQLISARDVCDELNVEFVISHETYLYELSCRKLSKSNILFFTAYYIKSKIVLTVQ